MSSTAEQTVKDTIPLWLATAVTVMLAMPFGLWLGAYNFTLWCAFVVWAQYFALGAQPSCLKIIIPSFALGVTLTSLTLWMLPLFSALPDLKTSGDLSLTVALCLGVALIVYIMRWSQVLQQGALPYFNGVAMSLGVYFTGSYPSHIDALPAPLLAGLWAIGMGLFGCALGVFNIWFLFRKEQ